MTKAELSTRVYEKVGITKKESATIVEMVFETIKSTLAEGESIKIAGFGTFLVRKRGTRKGRNLKTGEEILIEPRRVVTFKPSLQFKEVVDVVDNN
jgi:integration host factor subunit alpha